MDFILQSLTTGAALLLTFLTFSNSIKVNKKANKWLGMFFSCVFLLSVDDLLVHENIYTDYPHLYGFVPVFSLLLTPTLYLSIVHFVNPIEKWTSAKLKHFAFVLFYLIVSFSFFIKDSASKLAAYQTDTTIHPDLLTIIILLFFLQVIIYGRKMLRKLNAHQKNTQLYSAKGAAIQLGWLRHLVIAVLVMLFFWFLEIFFQSPWIHYSFNATLFIGVFLLAHFSVQQQAVFPVDSKEQAAVVQLLSEVTEVSDKTTDALLSKKELQDLSKILQEVMVSQKPYLDNELNLPKLADKLAIPAYKLSFLLNNHIGENFATFINKHRAEAAKAILSNPKMTHLTLVQVAYEAGYNSKTVFNTHFKKNIGTSPSAYRKKHK